MWRRVLASCARISTPAEIVVSSPTEIIHRKPPSKTVERPM
jgi:hypothetical protein